MKIKIICLFSLLVFSAYFLTGNILHKHNWIMKVKTYTPPYIESLKGGEIPLLAIERANGGVTTILWECSVCKETRIKELAGMCIYCDYDNKQHFCKHCGEIRNKVLKTK